VVHNGVLRVFFRGNDGALWQDYHYNGDWTLQRIGVGGGINSAPSAVMHGTVLRVFVRGNDNSLWYWYWATAWGYQDLGGSIT
jgi:hypothetical protein